MVVPASSSMASDRDQHVAAASPGRPPLGKRRRVRVTTTVEPTKLARLREHAARSQQSLGELADAYVQRVLAQVNQPP